MILGVMTLPATMTYNEFIAANPDFITVNISDLDKQTISDWFGLRIVCDDDNFPRFFNRVLARDYPRYLQIMRVQPGISGTQYDWFVQEYAAAINTVTNSITNSGADTETRETKSNNSYTGTGKNTIVHGKTETLSGTDTETNTVDHGMKTTRTGTENGGTEYNISEKTVTSGSQNDAHTGTDTHSYITGGMTDTRTIAGSYADMHSGTDTTNNSGTDSEITTHHADHAEGAKVTPMSNSGAVSTGTGSEGVAEFSVNFDNSASSIARANDHAHDSRSMTRGTAISQSHATSDSRTYGIEINKSGTQSSKPYSETTTHTGGEQTEHGEKITTTFNDITNDFTRTGTENRANTTSESVENSGTDTETRKTDYGRVITDGGTDTQENTANNATEITGTETVTSNAGKTQNTETVGKTERNGRHEDPAAILARVIPLIQSTSAWLWLSRQLEPCFIRIYDI